MSPRNIVIGQNVDPQKAGRARELRQTMTEAEKTLWENLRGNRLGGFHFRRQQVIAGYIVDFYCHSASLAVELDGPVHENQADYDLERDGILKVLGLRVVRIKNKDVFEDLEAVLQKIYNDCEEDEISPPAPLRNGEG
jgi:very-short-patch-repair endonuclease